MPVCEGDDEARAEGVLAEHDAPLCPPVAGYLSECVTSIGVWGAAGIALSLPLCACVCVRKCWC